MDLKKTITTEVIADNLTDMISELLEIKKEIESQLLKEGVSQDMIDNINESMNKDTLTK